MSRSTAAFALVALMPFAGALAQDKKESPKKSVIESLNYQGTQAYESQYRERWRVAVFSMTGANVASKIEIPCAAINRGTGLLAYFTMVNQAYKLSSNFQFKNQASETAAGKEMERAKPPCQIPVTENEKRELRMVE